MSLSQFTGNFDAFSYAYGVNRAVGALVVDNPTTTPTGAATLVTSFGAVSLTSGATVAVPNVNAPIAVGSTAGANLETVTPSAVSNPTPNVYDSCQITATFTYAHGKGENVSSGSIGLQEAINACAAYGGGVVTIDAKWAAAGGTQAMVDAAVLPAGVQIVDNRSGNEGAVQQAFTVLAKATTTTLNDTPFAVTPVPPAGSYIDVLDWTLVNKNNGTAYASGGVITLGYGNNNTAGAPTYSASAATVAATFLTSPTVTQVIKTAGALATQAASNILGKAIFIMNATGDFTNAGASPTLEVIVNYRVVNT